ncbi:STAS domain-containing protein [Aquabacterium sp.]|uniref:STAS domain-containing protein n=1 Tax=Aquabacterium sp. TaxID=1872578 RepID=UPI0019B093D5|nr:STAS domain-containing protein [Aquabacterium sp.]MBC7701480.1 STAS domain-containing protein [Aquabacterium sp.]
MSTACMPIEGEMNIYRAAELKETLLNALKGASSLELDLHGITEIDSAGIQLLMLVKATGQATDCEVKLVNHSPAVLEVFELLDLAAHFGDPLLVPA